MSRDRDTRRGDEERAAEAVRGLSRSTIDPRFRERLKADFVSGRLEETEAAVPRPARRTWWWALAPAAAAVLVIVLLARAPRAPEWTVRALTAESVRVDDREVSRSELESGRTLPDRATVQVPEGWMEVGLGDMVAVQLNGESEVELPAPTERDPTALEVLIARGEVLFLTGEKFAGTTLHVVTPEGRVEVTGTAFAVYRDAEVTCVCVLEGRARVGISTDDLEMIVPGKRKVMFSDGSAPKILDIMPQHREGVEAFVQRVRSDGWK